MKLLSFLNVLVAKKETRLLNIVGMLPPKENTIAFMPVYFGEINGAVETLKELNLIFDDNVDFNIIVKEDCDDSINLIIARI